MKSVLALCAALGLCGCALLPLDERHGAATIETFKQSIQCEIAAVATDPRFAHFQLSKWLVKTSLDMTLIDTLSGDAKATVPIPNPTLPNIFPGGSLSGKFTHTGHVDFAVSIPEAIAIYGDKCQGPDPSQTHLGLAAWIAATLDQIQPENHGGLSYTVDVDVIASVGSRFGFVFSIVNTVDSGAGYQREGVHHLVVSMSEPTPPSGPLAVRVVGPVRVVDSRPVRQPQLQPDASSGQQGEVTPEPPHVASKPRVRRVPQLPYRNPALEDPNLNRMLQQQAPVRLAPGTVLR
ncbi:hypothetical protein ACNJYA_09450 [Bradyrhizobium sp. DASA03068]|uniref:hypothetical protein n=1 Tax=Bradyrhizobium sp. BLXBL-01 TaxID=3395915 RepID=UPI003F70BAC3